MRCSSKKVLTQRRGGTEVRRENRESFSDSPSTKALSSPRVSVPLRLCVKRILHAYTIAGAGSKLSAAAAVSAATILPSTDMPRRISSGGRPAKLSRSAPASCRDTAK